MTAPGEALSRKHAAGTEAPRPGHQRGRRRTFKLRPWLRAIHRDVGYLAVGLTFVYALSGLAVNHIADWDPNFTQIEREHRVTLPDDTSDDTTTAQAVLDALGRSGPISDVYRPEADKLDISLEASTFHVDLETGDVFEEGQEARWFLRAANWLHLNRGKKAWTYVADAYAVFLLYLATSGLLMLPGRKGFAGRGAVLAGLGALVPIAYVVLSGP